MPRIPPKISTFNQAENKAPKTLEQWIVKFKKSYLFIKNGEHLVSSNKAAILTAYKALINEGLIPLLTKTAGIDFGSSADDVPMLSADILTQHDKLKDYFTNLAKELAKSDSSIPFAKVVSEEYCQPFLKQYTALKQGTEEWVAFMTGKQPVQESQPFCAIM